MQSMPLTPVKFLRILTIKSAKLFSKYKIHSFSTVDVVQQLKPTGGAVYLDLTFGSGEHSNHLLQSCDCTVLGLDCDRKVSSYLENVRDKFPKRFLPYTGKFSHLPNALKETHTIPALRKSQFHGIILDLGVSQLQYEDNRGFNMSRNEPLDLRMDTSFPLSASQIVKHADKDDLTRIFRVYGRVKRARTLASDIVEARYLFKKMETNQQLLQILNSSHKKLEHFNEGGEHEIEQNVRHIFEALRRFVNDEMNELEFIIRFGEHYLEKGSRVIIITNSELEEQFLNKILFEKMQPHGSQVETSPFLWTVIKSLRGKSETERMFVVQRN